MSQTESPESNTTPPAPAYTSRCTSSFLAVLGELKISLAISTCKAGKLIIVRKDGDGLNTLDSTFYTPMGIAFDAQTQRLAIGTRHQIWEFHNHPQLASTLNPQRPRDAAFLPRVCHYSGDIRSHEVAWVNGAIWAVNTRFSCLCTFDGAQSFVPRWRPPFVSALAPEDRCHMNGFTVVDGRVRYVTCLGLTDEPEGWRKDKSGGGCVLDVDSGEPVIRGLTMPHSPRIYLGRAWLLESGCGTFSLADFQTGRTEIVAKFPGFTRGLDFCGPYAFVGLSQVRESAIFSDIPLVQEHAERVCGIGVVDLRSGEVVARLQFDGAVQEIFSIVVLPFEFPELIKHPGPELDFSYTLPDEAFAELPAPLRSPSRSSA